MKTGNKRRALLLIVTVMLLMSIPAVAEAKDVTRTYKTKVTELLSSFDSYLGTGSSKSMAFRFDDYARTTMAVEKAGIYNQKLSSVKTELKAVMKEYFGTSLIKLKKYFGNKITNPSYLYQNKNGTVTYVYGDWGTNYPKGSVGKILTRGSFYVVTYNIRWYGEAHQKKHPLMGSYQITLKKSSKNPYGFIITGIKRTAAKL